MRNYNGCGYLNSVPERSDSDIIIVPADETHNITLDGRYSEKVFTLRPGYDMAMYYYNPE
jgi:hypothetical protein